MFNSEFQVTLASNVLSDAKNSPNSFETKLARPVDLNGDWEVALIDITFPHEWYNIHTEYEFAVAIPKKGTPLTGDIDQDVSPDQPRPTANNLLGKRARGISSISPNAGTKDPGPMLRF